MHISGIMPSLEQQIERSRERVQRLRLLHPTIDCLHCHDTGLVEGGTHFVADDNERVTIQPKVEPCPMCDKGKEIQHERERAAWIERINDEVGVPAGISEDTEAGRFHAGLYETVHSRVARNSGTYLYGGVGTGKSTVAAAVLLEFVRSTGNVRRSPRSVGCFVTTADYLQGIRDTYGTGVHRLPGQEGMDKQGMGANVLVCDDLGTERLTEWGAEQLQVLIDHRTSNGLPTIFTSNFSLNELEQRINRTRDKSTGNTLYPAGSRIASRIAGACEEIEVRGQDYRRKNRRAS